MNRKQFKEWRNYFLKNLGIEFNKIPNHEGILKNNVPVNIIKKTGTHTEFLTSAIAKKGTRVKIISIHCDGSPFGDGGTMIFRILNPQLEIGDCQASIEDLVKSLKK